MTALAVDSTQGVSYTNRPTETLSRGTPWYHKTCCINDATGLSNGMNWADNTMKCAKLSKSNAHRSPWASPKTALGI